MAERDRRLTACHEAGHALVSLYCTHTDPLHKVSIIPRGKMLGGAMYFPEGDKVSQSQSELSEQMVIAVAGRGAEQLMFNEVNSGAYADVRQCSLIARAMVAKLGMSPKLGFIEYATTDADMGYLGLLSRPEYSEETARVIDDEVRRLVGEAMARATALLTEHRDQLEKLTEALLERETLSAEDVGQLLGMPLPERLAAMRRPPPPAGKPKPADPAGTPAAEAQPGLTPAPLIGAPPAGLEPKPGA
jgi:cell division protease FtsH